MKLYLDDDLAGRVLTGLLRQGGHDVLLPADAGLTGKHDAIHFRHAVREGRVILSRNYDDFQWLHELVMETKGRHPGVVVVRRGGDPRGKMKPKDIVRAIGKLIAAGVPLADQYIILNHWR